MAQEQETTPISRRGFASMDPEKQREIASRGGKAAHAAGRAHRFSSEQARDAGKKGGASVSKDRAHMAEIGRKGGTKRGMLRAAQAQAQAQTQAQADAATSDSPQAAE